MNVVLVTGGTGVLGRVVVDLLMTRGHAVRVLTRRQDAQVPPGAGRIVGNLVTGEGLDDALDGVDTVVHCASDPRRHGKVDPPGTRRLIATASGRPHLVYVSIVGCDKIPLGYYRTKVECERAVAGSGLPWTVLRTTQFHDLLLTIAYLASRLPIIPLPRGVRDQPIDVREVAAHLAGIVESGPCGRAGDLGGPQVLTIEEAVRDVARARGRRARIVGIPFRGRVYAGLREGHHLLSGGETGTRTFAEYVAEHVHGGRVDLPYRIR